MAHLAPERHGAKPATRCSIRARVLELGFGCMPSWRKVRASSELRTSACRPGKRPEYHVCMRPSVDTSGGGTVGQSWAEACDTVARRSETHLARTVRWADVELGVS